jgi:2'-5' RNA ligase
LLCSTVLMRIFVALDLEAGIRERIQKFIEEAQPLAPRARWVRAESLHVTLKFIGEKPDALVKEIEQTLASVRAEGFEFRLSGAGFFPTPRAARVFWIGIDAGELLPALARAVEDALLPLGIAKQERAFSPHLTLARAGGGSGSPGWRRGDKVNRQFARLQDFLEKRSPPDFGASSAREFFLYRSQLSPAGSRYTKIARFPLQSSIT